MGHSAEVVLELFDLVEELVLLSVPGSHPLDLKNRRVILPVRVVVSSPRLVERSTFAGSDEGDHDDGQSSPPEPLVLSKLSVSPAAVENSVVGWVRKLESYFRSVQFYNCTYELSGNEHLGSLVSWLRVKRVTKVHCGLFFRCYPLDRVLG